MYKNKQKVTLSKQELKTSSSPLSIMAIRRKNDQIISKCNLPDKSLTKKKKNPWPSNDSGSSSVSWDGNSRATSSSWPEEIEEAATRKVLNLWYAIERTLYKEDEQVPLGNVMNECIQWRTQIPHFRVVGTKKRLEIAENDSETRCSGECKSLYSADRRNDDVHVRNHSRQKKSHVITKHQQEINKAREEVIDRILKFIYNELEKEEDIIGKNGDDNVYDDDDDDNDVESTCKNLNQALTITPAITYSGKRNVENKKIIRSNNRMSSANINESFHATERRVNAIASTKTQKNTKNARDNNSTIYISDEDDSEIVELTLQHIRNKPGTVFNEKIVVSPVPYAVTTRESFCTLKTTPIGYAGHLLELSTPHVLNKNRTSASKTNSAQKISHICLSQRHSAWQSSISPVAWPKNVRLAPIDLSRLSSSKKRSSTVSPTIPSRSRNSLSPILRPIRISTTTESEIMINDENPLRIHGKQIVSCTVKPNLLKTGFNHYSRTSREIKKKTNKKQK